MRPQQRVLSPGGCRPQPTSLGAALLNRVRLDLVAGGLALLLSMAALGASLLYFTVQDQDLHLSSWRMGRWLAAALPAGALGVFVLSYRQMTPWFAGVLAGMAAWQLPLLSPVGRIAAFLVLCVVLGAVDVVARMRRDR